MPAVPSPARATISVRTICGRLAGVATESGVIQQTGLLWIADTLSHAVDYGFHLYLGRALPLGAFGQFQSLNSLALVVLILAFALQPVAARYTAAPPAGPDGPATQGAILRRLGRQSLGVAAIATTVFALLSFPIARATRLPRPLILMLTCLFPLGAPRGVALGVLQGQTRLGMLGLTNLTNALVRTALAIAGIELLHWGVRGAAATVVIGAAAALFASLLAVRNTARQPGSLDSAAVREGWHIAFAGLLMSVSYMLLTNMDVIWVNRIASGTVADAYGRVVVLRRVVAVFATAISMAILPRVARGVRRRERPDRAIALSLGVVLAAGLALTALYAVAGPAIYRLAYGAEPGAASRWIVAMAGAMLGYSISLVWVNVLVAADPRPLSWVMVALAAVQTVLYALCARTPGAAIAILFGSAWLLSLAGAALYWYRVRPGLNPPACSATGVGAPERGRSTPTGAE